MQQGKLAFRQERLEGGWPIIHVVRESVIVGRITRHPKNGSYRFFPGDDNNLAFQFEHRDLDALKQLIEAASSERPFA